MIRETMLNRAKGKLNKALVEEAEEVARSVSVMADAINHVDWDIYFANSEDASLLYETAATLHAIRRKINAADVKIKDEDVEHVVFGDTE